MHAATSSDGTTIAFDRSGHGPPVIFVGGALTDRSASEPMAALLDPHFTVFSYDRRGRGDSGDTPPYAVQREIEDIGALIDEAGGSASVVGGSSGAVLALEAAAGGLPITRLALYEPPFIVDDSRAPLRSDYVTTLTELAAAGLRGDAVEFFMTEGVEVPADVVAEMRSAPYWAALENVAHTLAYDGAVMGDMMSGTPLPLRRFASVEVPTLVIDGGASPAWARSAVAAIVDVLRNAQRRTLEGQTHDVAPEALAPVVGEFLGSPNVEVGS
jgi:pimeloyl-ACP methyl ester carboxylesterase